MFTVAGDPREAQRETRKFPFSLEYGYHCLYSRCSANSLCETALYAKSSMENPSLRVSGHGGSTNRTFIVEDDPEDEYGQWASDEATGEQGHIDDERSCFWTWDDN